MPGIIDLDELERRQAQPAAPQPAALPVPQWAPDGSFDLDAAEGVPADEADRSKEMMLNGLTFGLRPRIKAAIESKSLSGPDYEEIKKGEWAKDDAYRERNPGKAFGYEMVGGIPTMFVPGLGAGRIARSAAMLNNANRLTQGSRVARAFGVGREVGSVGHESRARRQDNGSLRRARLARRRRWRACH